MARGSPVETQVLKKRLALVHPTVSCENFIYEEGPDLEQDEVRGSDSLRSHILLRAEHRCRLEEQERSNRETDEIGNHHRARYIYCSVQLCCCVAPVVSTHHILWLETRVRQ